MAQFTIIGGILKEVLKARGLGSGDALAKLKNNWTAAVGKKIAQHASPHMLREGRLTLTVDSPAWMSQLSMLSPEIIEKINLSLKEPAVRELKFQLGIPSADKQTGMRASGKAPIKKRTASPDEKEAADTAAAMIGDKELRTIAKKMLLNSCRRVR